MTCGHCQQAVTKEVSALSGVSQVDVNLETGEVTIESADAIGGDSLVAAVTSAGFSIRD